MCLRTLSWLVLGSFLCALFAGCSDDLYYGGDNPHYSSRKDLYGEWVLEFEYCDYLGFMCPHYMNDNRYFNLNDNGKSFYLSEKHSNMVMAEPISWDLESGNIIRFSASEWNKWAYGKDGEKLGSLRNFVEEIYLAKYVYNDSSRRKCKYLANNDEKAPDVCVWAISNFDSLITMFRQETIEQWELMEEQDTLSISHCEIYKDWAGGRMPPNRIYVNCQPKLKPNYIELGNHVRDTVRLERERDCEWGGCVVIPMLSNIDTISVSDVWKIFIARKED